MPPEVDEALGAIYICEFTTVNTKGQPMTWPAVPYYNMEAGHLVIAVSVAFPVKAYNARKHPQVSMLFSEPTGCGLVDPPAVLVQGDAVVAEVLDYTPDIIQDGSQTAARKLQVHVQQAGPQPFRGLPFPAHLAHRYSQENPVLAASRLQHRASNN